ncbi:hypothetical protein E2C01_062343 [Portunus trituberculatus]|uniref:Uncharacterized protein n=1 Tax=Portunus trituberculatus TaxID=210409 RepID=A0A5B7HDS6_PORTR|nr:hypothetical protein [Portunus trituberculatus]
MRQCFLACQVRRARALACRTLGRVRVMGAVGCCGGLGVVGAVLSEAPVPSHRHAGSRLTLFQGKGRQTGEQ